MMDTTGYSKQQQREADRLVAIADRWAEGHNPRTGVRFNIFTSRRDPKVVYYTRIDGKPGACTCPGARDSKSGRCFHLLACQIVTERVRQEAARPTAYESLHGNLDAF